MKYSIVIPTYNHLEDCLKPCLEKIFKYTDLIDGEIVVVANGCKDDTKQYLELQEIIHPELKHLWFDEGLGYTKAINEGVKASIGENIIFMNNDAILLQQEKNTWIRYLLDALKDNVGVTGNLKLYDASVERRFCLFFCAATPRRLWDKIGGLDESWSPGGGEDIEYCLKIEQLGYKVIQVPDDKECEIKDGYNVNAFPLWHKAESTVMDEEHKEMWVKHIAEVRQKLEHMYKLPEGWFYQGDVDEYRRLVEDVPEDGTICELGCYKGRSLCSVADIIKRKKLNVHVVDIFTGTDCEKKEENYRNIFEENIKRFGIYDQVKIHEGYTKNVINDFSIYAEGNLARPIFDLLFIDASHLYEDVKRDIEDWLPLIKNNGVISGHDYGNWEGVSKAVNERWDNVRVNSEHFGIDSGIAIGSVWSKRL
jgi:glycosyltransferase involved in cell wall biosynthesis